MNTQQVDFGRLLLSLKTKSDNPDIRQCVDVASSSPAIAEMFVEELIKYHFRSASREQAISDSMRTLEAIAEISSLAACFFMAHLWIAANNLYMHDVCDSIDLWLDSHRSPELAHHLLLLAKSQADVVVQHHFEKMAT